MLLTWPRLTAHLDKVMEALERKDKYAKALEDANKRQADIYEGHINKAVTREQELLKKVKPAVAPDLSFTVHGR